MKLLVFILYCKNAYSGKEKVEAHSRDEDAKDSLTKAVHQGL